MYTFGSDPELMLFLNGTPRSAIGVIKGNIENRISKNGHEFYYDNVLAECAVKPGASKKEVIDNFQECLQIYASMVRPYELVTQASVMFEDSELTHPDARRAGCAKDFCAYEMKQQEGPIAEISQGNLRSCGGHIHLGAEILTGDGPEPILAVYMLDLILGVPSLWLDKDPTSPRRRAIYGKAGRYRVKTYGIEYRPLSNFWLESPQMVGLIYDLSLFAVECVENGKGWEFWNFDIERFLESDNLADAWQCSGYDSVALQQGINQTDKTKVTNHLKLAESLMPASLRSELHKMMDRQTGETMYQNWRLR
jgi:hypothetical protein